MTTEIKTIDTNIKMLDTDKSDLISFIPKKWDEWDSARDINKALILETKKHLFPEKISKQEDTFNNTKPKTELNKLPKIFKIRESAISHYWNSTFKSLMTGFNIDFSAKQGELAQIGQDKEQIKQYIDTAKENANIMKESIVDAWNKTKVKAEFRKALTNWIDKGEGILFVSWDKRFKNVRRSGKVQQVPVYDGVKIISVDPEDYVFDVSRKGKDGCPQIYRSWIPFTSIKDNPAYKEMLTPKDLSDLALMTDENTDKNNSNNDKSEGDGKEVNKGLIRVLDYWGDIKLGDRYLSNMHITVIAGKFVVCFEYNPHIIDPFIYCDYEEHPETKRGIGPLVRCLPLNDATTDLFKLQKQALIFTVNKNYLSPKGAFSGKINLNKEGGNIVEYDPALMPQSPIPMDYTGFERGWNFMEFFDKELEVTSGEYAYDIGDNSGKARTLGEAQIISSGNNTRRGLYISDLSEKMLIPCAEKTGELLANYKDGVEVLKVKSSDGSMEFKIIDNTIRQGNFEYTVGDTQAIMDKQANLPQFNEITQQVSKLTPLNGKEIARYAYSASQIENPDRFLEVDPVEKALSGLPPQAKEMIMQVIQDPSIMQKLQQPAMPNAEQIKDMLSKYTVDKAQLPEPLKAVIDTFIGVDPTQQGDLKNDPRAGTGNYPNGSIA